MDVKAVNLLNNLDASTAIITVMVYHGNVSLPPLKQRTSDIQGAISQLMFL